MNEKLHVWGTLFLKKAVNSTSVLLMVVNENLMHHFTNHFLQDWFIQYQINKTLLMCKLTKVDYFPILI